MFEKTTGERLSAIEDVLPIMNSKLDVIMDMLQTKIVKIEGSPRQGSSSKNSDFVDTYRRPESPPHHVPHPSTHEAASNVELNVDSEAARTTNQTKGPQEGGGEEEQVDDVTEYFGHAGNFAEEEKATVVVASDAWMVNPKNRFRMVWDLGVVLPLLVYLTIMMPFRLTFVNEAPLFSFMYWFEFVLDFMFIFDIFLNFRTGYFVRPDGQSEESGLVEYDRSRVAINYLKTWLVLDVVSGIPFALLDLLMSGSANRGPLKSTKTLKLLRFLKLGRLFKLEKILSNLDQDTQDIIADFFNDGKTRSVFMILKLVLYLSYAVHLMACGFVAVGRAGDKAGVDNWFAHEIKGPFTSEDTTGVNGDDPVYSIYIASFYFGLTSTTSIGFGDIVTRNNLERVYVIFLEFLGAVIFATIVGAITSVVTSMDMNARKTAEQLDAVASFVALRQFPTMLGRRIRRHFRHFYSIKSAIDESKIFSELSTQLRSEVSVYLVTEILGKHSFFNGVSQPLWPQLLPLLRPMGFDKGETVCTQGTEATEMYVVISGRFQGEIKVEGEVKPRLRNIVNGQSIDTLKVLGVWDKCVETVVALTAGEVYSVSEQDFMGLYMSGYSADSELASLEEMKHREVGKMKMVPDAFAPTEFGRPLYFSHFSCVEVSLVHVVGFFAVKKYLKSWNPFGRTLTEDIEAWVVVDLVDIDSGMPFNDLWKHSTAKASPRSLVGAGSGSLKHVPRAGVRESELFCGETVRWADITVPLRRLALRARLFIQARNSEKEVLIGSISLGVEEVRMEAEASIFGGPKEKGGSVNKQLPPRTSPEVSTAVVKNPSPADEWVKSLPVCAGQVDKNLPFIRKQDEHSATAFRSEGKDPEVGVTPSESPSGAISTGDRLRLIVVATPSEKKLKRATTQPPRLLKTGRSFNMGKPPLWRKNSSRGDKDTPPSTLADGWPQGGHGEVPGTTI